MEFIKLLEKAKQYLPPEKLPLLEEAYKFASEKHQGQVRLSGGPFMEHPLQTAYILAELQLDASSLAAALLHDVGKVTAPPRLWERVIVVLAEHFLPARSERWAQEEVPRGWRRRFIIRRLHPGWGAELAAQAGATPRTVALIRQHHSTAENDALLAALQAADDT